MRNQTEPRLDALTGSCTFAGRRIVAEVARRPKRTKRLIGVVETDRIKRLIAWREGRRIAAAFDRLTPPHPGSGDLNDKGNPTGHIPRFNFTFQ